MGEAVLEKTGARVGDTLRISLPALGVTFDATIEDTVREPMGSPVYVTRETLEEVLDADGVPGWRDAIDPARDRRRSPWCSRMMSTASAVLDQVRDLPGVASVTDVRAVWTTIEQYMGLFYLMVGLMLAFGGVLAVALIYNVVSVNLAERTGEIASMRANGVSNRRIGGYVLAENMILTAIGVLPGALVAHAAASWLMSTYSTDMLSFDLETSPTTMALTIARHVSGHVGVVVARAQGGSAPGHRHPGARTLAVNSAPEPRRSAVHGIQSPHVRPTVEQC